ncbi:MAG TPA: hypothetical protein PLL78_04000 [Fimbriimonadaceae bacterium]|nr:hypothetical protein [Fimbriimonadaceae bacterium]HRJ95824.1 hypothetical protein [Fimbriimonadaceae bacterium]
MARNDQYPAFSDHVRKSLEAAKQSDMHAVTCMGCGLGLGALIACGIFLSTVVSPFIAWAATSTIGLPVLIATLMFIDKKLTSPKTAEGKRRAEAVGVMKNFKSAIDRRRLGRELDPVVGQLLEACSIHHQRIKVALENSVWTSEEVGAQRSALRNQISTAADSAMDEAVLLARDCLGKPGKDSWKEVVEDALDLDLVDVLQSLTGMKFDDKGGRVHRSPHARIVFVPLRDIAEKLKLTAGEVERMTHEFYVRTPATGAIGASTTSLDVVLMEMQQVRLAEEELNQQQQGL